MDDKFDIMLCRWHEKRRARCVDTCSETQWRHWLERTVSQESTCWLASLHRKTRTNNTTNIAQYCSQHDRSI